MGLREGGSGRDGPEALALLGTGPNADLLAHLRRGSHHSVEDAMRAVEACLVSVNMPEARELAETYFDARLIAGKILSHALNSVPAELRA